MRTFRNVPLKKQQALLSLYPVLDTDDGDKIRKWHSVAISIFDHWLNRDEYSQFFTNRTLELQSDIDKQWLSFYRCIALEPNLFLAKYRSLGRVIFKEPRSPKLLTNRLSMSDESSFIKLVMPEYNAIYEQYYDDTHFLYFECHQLVKPLLDTIRASGMYVLPLSED